MNENAQDLLMRDNTLNNGWWPNVLLYVKAPTMIKWVVYIQ